MFEWNVCFLLWVFVYVTSLMFIVKSCVLATDRTLYVLPITFLSKRSAALNTAETLWVPVLVQSRHHFLNNKVGVLI